VVAVGWPTVVAVKVSGFWLPQSKVLIIEVELMAANLLFKVAEILGRAW
jgi:hypothetical protein